MYCIHKQNLVILILVETFHKYVRNAMISLLQVFTDISCFSFYIFCRFPVYADVKICCQGQNMIQKTQSQFN